MQLYRYSPIDSKVKLLEAISYVSDASSEMCKKIIGEAYPISSLTVFSHYFDEFETLKELQKELGEYVGEVLGPRVKLHTPITVGSNVITHLRIREPDPYHTQVGSNDYDIPDYQTFKKDFLTQKPHNLRLLVRPEYELIEFWDPDFDVVGYVLSEPERSKR